MTLTEALRALDSIRALPQEDRRPALMEILPDVEECSAQVGDHQGEQLWLRALRLLTPGARAPMSARAGVLATLAEVSPLDRLRQARERDDVAQRAAAATRAALGAAVRAAGAAGVPVAVIAREAGLARQLLYRDGWLEVDSSTD